ncbi:unnamed protein product [Discula destructiva]
MPPRLSVCAPAPTRLTLLLGLTPTFLARYTSAAPGSPFDLKNPDAAARARRARERWIERLKAEHGHSWQAILQEHDERSARNEERIREENRLRKLEKEQAKAAGSARREVEGRANRKSSSSSAAAQKQPTDAWAARVQRAVNLASEKVVKPLARRDERTEEETARAAGSAKGEAARNAWIARLKVEHGNGWEEIVRESDERRRVNEEKIREAHRLRKKGQLPKGGTKTPVLPVKDREDRNQASF